MLVWNGEEDFTVKNFDVFEVVKVGELFYSFNLAQVIQGFVDGVFKSNKVKKSC